MAMSFVTALQVAEARGLKPMEDGSGYSAGAFAEVGIPFMGGCYNCHAMLAAYNAYPSKIGYWLDAECIEGTDLGFETVEDFEAFSNDEDGL
jgi:hypothetical protein